MPEELRTGGLTEVHHSATGLVGSWTKINGDVTRSENLQAEQISQVHSTGDYQSGDSLNPTVYFNDHQDYATLRGFKRTKKFVALVFADGTILKSKVAVYLKCWLVPKPARSEGDSEFALSFNEQADEMYEKIASLV